MSCTVNSTVVQAAYALSPIARLRARILGCIAIPEEDWDGIDFIFGGYASHRIPGDPLWSLYVDASGGGKTELLRSLSERPDALFMSKLTAKSLKSGYRDPKKPSADPSLLPKLDEKVLIIKDLSPILSMPRDARNSIVSDLRDAYDGFSDDCFGNLGQVSYKARFTLIAASTLAIERFGAVDQELGERFVKFRARGQDSLSKVRRAITNVGKHDGIRQEIREAVAEFFDSLSETVPDTIPSELGEAIATVADFTATARSHVPRDRNHNLLYEPRPEVGTRLANELSKLLLSLAHVRGKREPDEIDLLTVCRVAEDCLSPNRLAVLSAVAQSERIPLPDKTARDTVADLEVLGILKSRTELKEDRKDSLREVRKLLKHPTLQQCATSRVSRFFNRVRESDPGTPSDIAH